MREQRVEFEECEEQKCLVLAALFAEAVVVVVAAAAAVVVVAVVDAAYCLSVIAHGQLTSLYQSVAVLSADANCETGAVWHHTEDK
jgi:hypothetical protein